MDRRRVLILCLMVSFIFVAAVGCGGGKLPEEKAEKTPSSQLPPDHPPIGGGTPPPGMVADSGPTDDNPLPLKLHGLNSVEEMKKGLDAAGDSETRAAFESGFRKTFTADVSKRDYAGAEADLEKILTKKPDFPYAYRALGYAKFNLGFNVQAALDNYLKAVELKPDYGEAHYALAFMYAMNELDKGVVHFKKAMDLGVPDERNLRERYYSGK